MNAKREIMNIRIYLIVLIMVSGLFLGCNQSTAYKDDKYEIGQIWEYETRDGEEESTLTIVALQNDDKEGVIISVYVDGLHIKNPAAENGFSSEIQHLPISKEALNKSVTKLKGHTEQLPDFYEGYWEWKRVFASGEAGVFPITVKEAVETMEDAINQGEEISK